MSKIISTSPDIYASSVVRQITAPTEIAAVPGLVVIAAPSAITCPLDLPRPFADDGKTLTIFSATAAAHIITTGVGGFNGLYRQLTLNGFAGNAAVLTATRGGWSVSTITRTQARSGTLS
jgi:hypothetical protein